MSFSSSRVRSQSAIEYLMTYGWAILLIAVVMGAMYTLGIFNPITYAPRALGGACQVFRPNGPQTIKLINFVGTCTNTLPKYVAQFNGQNSYVDVGNSNTVNITGQFTMTAWVDPNPSYNFAAYAQIIARGASGGSPVTEFGWGNSGGNTCSAVYTTNGPNTAYGGNICTKRWYFVGMTYNGVSETFYINGVASGTGTVGFNTLLAGYDTGIGREPTRTGLQFNGSMSNVQIYNTALSANNIQSMYVAGIGGPPLILRNLVGWWPLNGDSNDYSGNKDNGAAFNVIYTSSWTNGYTLRS